MTSFILNTKMFCFIEPTRGHQSQLEGEGSCSFDFSNKFVLKKKEEKIFSAIIFPSKWKPTLCLRLEGIGTADVQSEDDQGTDSEHDPPYWQQLVGREVLAGLRPQEIKRQEVINGEAINVLLLHIIWQSIKVRYILKYVVHNTL